jgi:hypothetical protein
MPRTQPSQQSDNTSAEPLARPPVPGQAFALPRLADLLRERQQLGAMLAAVASLVLLIVGVVLHSHFGARATLCSSEIGTLGQASSTGAALGCGSDGLLAGLGVGLIVFGGLVLAGAIGTWLMTAYQRSAGTGRES